MVAGELGLPVEQATALIRRTGTRFRAEYRPGLIYEHIDLNLDTPALADARVRRALLLALDRGQIVARLFEGRQTVATTMVNPLDWMHDRSIPAQAHDPIRAAALLAEAGWTPGPSGIRVNAAGERLSFELMTTAGNRSREAVQQVIQAQWRAIGVEARIRNEPPRVLFGESLSRRRFGGAAMYAWVSSPESVPRSSLHSEEVPSADRNWSGQNYTGFRNAEVDALIEALPQELDRERRPRALGPAPGDLRRRAAQPAVVVPSGRASVASLAGRRPADRPPVFQLALGRAVAGAVILRRLAQILMTTAILSAVAFWLMALMPGDPIDLALAADPRLTPEDAARLRALHGLDQPVTARYLAWAGAVVEGRFGHSRLFAQPVAALLGPALRSSLELLGLALLLAAVAGVLLGGVAALRPPLAPAVQGLALIAQAMPGFWFGILLIILFAVELGWLPAGGTEGGWRGLILPVATLCLAHLAAYARHSASALGAALGEPHIRTARAKGAGEARVLLRQRPRQCRSAAAGTAGARRGRAGTDPGALIPETVIRAARHGQAESTTP
jgi:ABC-type dipeptide/oligopeptide/nickel transport system permease component